MDRWKSFFTIAAIYHVLVGVGLAVFVRQVLGVLVIVASDPLRLMHKH